MPAARSVAAVARPSARATDGRPVAAIAGALRDGAPGRRCTLPPSWSTMSSSGARTAAGCADAPQRARERADLRRRAEVGAQEDDARRLAAADARQQRPRRRAPGEREDDVLAGELARRSARGSRRGRAGRLCVRLGPRRRPLGSSLAPQAASARATAASAAARALTARSWSPRSGAARTRRSAAPRWRRRRAGPSRPASACSAAADRDDAASGCRRARCGSRRRRCRCERAEACDRERDRLGLGGLVRAARRRAGGASSRARCTGPEPSGCAPSSLDVDAGRVGRVGHVDDDRDVGRAARSARRARAGEGDLLLHDGDRDDVAGRAAGLGDEPRRLERDVAAEAVVHRARDDAVVGQLDRLAVDHGDVADAHAAPRASSPSSAPMSMCRSSQLARPSCARRP